MGRHKAEMGKQSAVREAAVHEQRQKGTRNAIIAGGAGFVAGAASASDNRPKPKEVKFNALGDLERTVAAKISYARFNTARKVKPIIRNIERRHPIIAHPVRGYLKGAALPIPGSGEVGAGIGLITGSREQFRRRPDAESILRKIPTRQTVRMKSKVKPICFSLQDKLARAKEKTQQSGVSAHDVATGAIEGGAGIFATDPILAKLRGEAWKNPLKEPLFSRRGLVGAAATGAVIGGAATGLIGAGLKKFRPHEDQEMSSRARVTRFSQPIQPGTRTAVTRDRYVKHIHDQDLERGESNILRSGVTGAAAGALLKGKLSRGRAAAIGAGLGAATTIGIRASTSANRDQFGDRTYAAKRAERAPWQAAGVVAGVAGAKKINDTLTAAKVGMSKLGRKVKIGAGLVGGALLAKKLFFASKGRTIQFMKMPPKGYIIPPRVTLDDVGEGMAGVYVPPDKARAHPDVITSVLKSNNIPDERINRILERSQKAGLIGRDRARGPIARINSRHEIIHSGQWQKSGFPKTKLGLLASEAGAYGGSIFSKHGKASGLSLAQKLKAFTGGVTKSYRHGVKANNITRLFASKAPMIHFAREEENPERKAYAEGLLAQKAEDRDWRKGRSTVNKVTQGAQRAGRLIRDVTRKIRGQKNVDSRGRERKNEWDKPWVRKLATGGVGVASLAIFHKTMRGTAPGTGIQRVREQFKAGKVGDFVEHHVPAFKHVRSAWPNAKNRAAGETASAVDNIASKFADKVESVTGKIPESSKGKMPFEKAEIAAKNRRNDILKGKTVFSAKTSLIRFTEGYHDELDDFAAQQGKRVKNYSDAHEKWLRLQPGKSQRNRERKSFLRRQDTQDALVKPAYAGGGLITGGLLARLYMNKEAKSASKPAPTPGAPTPHAPNVTHMPHIHPDVEALFRKRASHLSAIDKSPMMLLSAKLDALLTT